MPSSFQCHGKIQKQCKQLKHAINLMEKYFIECIEQAEVKSDISLVIKGHGLKWKIKKTKKDLYVIDKQYLDLKPKRRKLTS